MNTLGPYGGRFGSSMFPRDPYDRDEERCPEKEKNQEKALIERKEEYKYEYEFEYAQDYKEKNIFAGKSAQEFEKEYFNGKVGAFAKRFFGVLLAF